MPSVLESPYLTRQLIAYIGNKRSLLGFLHDVFERLADRHPVETFMDPFAGSGAVARLARLMGWRVLANDWEFYSWVINSCHLEVDARRLPGMFRGLGGIDGALAVLNTLPEPAPGKRYISRYYAPERTESADYRTERLFYTAENARIIDAARGRIERWYPGWELDRRALAEKTILLAALLYQSATHTNTSGVFKACHKGFGGHGREALGRIMRRIELQRPVLAATRRPARMHRMEAERFASGRSADLCYLDPPYTTHQYGSNYHMLNTIALWDRPPVNQNRTADGRLAEKAGIRKDWTRTRSPYCYRTTALAALEDLLGALDCRFVVLSYNTEGLIPFEALYEVLARRGRVELFSSGYVKYRGGKQSLRRQIHNLELVLAVERGAAAGRSDRQRIRHALLERKLAALWKQSFDPDRVREVFGVDADGEGEGAIIRAGGRAPGDGRAPVARAAALHMPYLYRFDLNGAASISPGSTRAGTASASQGAAPPRFGGYEELRDFHERLSRCVCADRREEVRILMRIIGRTAGTALGRRMARRALWLLRKFAFKKYRETFTSTWEEVHRLFEEHPGLLELFGEELESIRQRAGRRFRG